MQTKFRRHQEVILLQEPDREYIEYAEESENAKEIPIKKGMKGRINVLLPNGKYHVEIIDKKGKIIAYAPMDEDSIGEAE